MGFLDQFKSMLGGSKLDVDERFQRLRSAVSGTMSHFYLARDHKTGQTVGLKIAKSDKLEAFESRFKGLKKPTEGEIAIGLKHPRLVETVEYGTTTKGLPYLVMEYLDGPGLHELIHNRDPELQGKRLNLIRQMAEAIGYVHDQGYIHRDICPRNFICSKDLSSLKLIDFGLSLPAKKEFMQPGNRTGTPHYMSPEVVRRRPTDQRLDIFSFGVTIYQLCTFEFPWPSPDSEKAALAAISHDTMPPRNILEYVPTLHPQLASAIMQCLAADPNKRPQTMREFTRLIWDLTEQDSP